MILLDTSVLIRALRGYEPWGSQYNDLAMLGSVCGHCLVYGEMLIGDRGGRQRFLADYCKYSWARLAPHRDVVNLVNARRLQGRGISWIDAHLLASTLIGQLRLWTADEPLAEVARELGVGWGPS